MSPWDAAPLSVFRHAKDATPAKTTTIARTLAAIQQGTYAVAINNLRAMRTVATTEAYTRAKGRLPAVTFGGTFAPTRTKVHLVVHSGLVHGDVDHLADVPQMQQRLSHDPYTAYCFVSPSGDGLKLGVRVQPVTSDEAYKQAWQVVSDYYQQHHGLTWDASGKDICRLCFVSWDTDLFMNPHPNAFTVPPPVARQTAHATAGAPATVDPFTGRAEGVAHALAAAVALITRSGPGTRHLARTKAAFLLGGYIGAGLLLYDQAYAVLEAAVCRHSVDPARAMQTVRDCLEAGSRAPLTAQASPRARAASTRGGQAHGLPFHTITSQEVPPWLK